MFPPSSDVTLSLLFGMNKKNSAFQYFHPQGGDLGSLGPSPRSATEEIQTFKSSYVMLDAAKQPGRFCLYLLGGQIDDEYK